MIDSDLLGKPPPDDNYQIRVVDTLSDEEGRIIKATLFCAGCTSSYVLNRRKKLVVIASEGPTPPRWAVLAMRRRATAILRKPTKDDVARAAGQLDLFDRPGRTATYPSAKGKRALRFMRSLLRKK